MNRLAPAFGAIEPFAPPEPEPLMRETEPPQPYPMEALGPLRAAAEAIHDMTQAPAALAAQSVLGVAALAVQGHGDVETLAGKAPASLFLLTVARSGERKSSCDKLAMRAVRQLEEELRDANAEEMESWRNRSAIWEAQRGGILKAAANAAAKANGTASHADLDALGPQPSAPLSPVLVATEPTLEGLVKLLAHSRPSLGLFNDEGGSFIGGHAMNQDNRLKTMSGLSSLWDGATINRTRAEGGSENYAGRRLSAHLMIQPVVAAGLLSDTMANGQGFLARFLMVEPESTIGTRLRVGHAAASDAALAAFAARTGEILRRDLPLRPRMRNELAPPLLALHPAALEALQAFALEVERQQAPWQELAEVRPFASKAAEHAARIAGVITLFADPDAGRVSADRMQAAITLAAFYLSEAQRLSGAAKVTADMADAVRMEKWLLQSWGEPFISATDAEQRASFGGTDRARKALNTLARFHRVLPVEGGAPVMGKHRREAFRINRGGA